MITIKEDYEPLVRVSFCTVYYSCLYFVAKYGLCLILVMHLTSHYNDLPFEDSYKIPFFSKNIISEFI